MFSTPSLRPTALIRAYSEPFSALTEFEDRRRFHPEDFYQPARELGGTNSPSPQVKKSFKVQLPFGLEFAAPQRTLVCVRRKQRKEVLFAKRQTGRGKKRRAPRRNWQSQMGC